MPLEQAPPRPARTRITTKPPSNNSDAVEVQPGVFEVPDEVEGSKLEEKAPRIPTPTISERMQDASSRMQQASQRVRAIPDRLRSTPAKKTTSRKPRTSVAGLIGTVWNFASKMVPAPLYPVANMLAIQSPVAGAILEDMVKDTVVDTFLQPVARVFKGGDVAFALVGPPVLVAAATMRPNAQPIIEPMLREALKSWINVAGPKLIERAQEEKEFQEKYGAQIDDMIRMIFTPPAGMVQDDNTVYTGQSVS